MSAIALNAIVTVIVGVPAAIAQVCLGLTSRSDWCSLGAALIGGFVLCCLFV